MPLCLTQGFATIQNRLPLPIRLSLVLLATLVLSLAVSTVNVQITPTAFQASNSHVKLDIDLKTGAYALNWGANASLPNVAGFVRLEDQRIRRTTDYESHTCRQSPVKDAFGEGTKIDLTHKTAGEPDLIHTFWIYKERPEVYVQLTAKGQTKLATNYFSPIAAEQPGSGLNLAKGDPLQVLFIPFDNDMFVRYNSTNWDENADTYEATAIYDNASRNGLVVGSIDHDLWKTGIAIRKREPKRIGGLTVYGGTAGYWSHDQELHGLVSGQTIKTARIMVGWFPDWRDGMEVYGQANALATPKLEWTGGIPFGWNSWSAVKMGLNKGHASAATDFLARTLVPAGFRSTSPTFVNLDSFWDNLKEPELIEFVENAHNQGLRAGIYWTPFVAWGKNLDHPVEGTDGKYRYTELAIKDSKGEPLKQLDGGWPLDPTHPGTKMRNTYHYARFIRWGFDYIKLDFMTHGALEGVRYDKSVQTGIAAYNVGMKDVLAAFDPKKIGRPFFISLSIAPLFPHQYAHARRMSCDAFSNIGASEYMLNSLTYGWWAHRTLYAFNDPDHLPVYQSSGEGVVTATEGQTRFASGVISGGMLLNGDDLTNDQARRRVQNLFSNREMLALAKRGLTFRPIEGNSGAAATDTFVLHDPVEKTYYLAAFNYGKEKVQKAIDLARAGIPADKRYLGLDLVNGKTAPVSRVMRVDLEATACAVVRLREQ